LSLAVEHGGAWADGIVERFEPYRPTDWSADRALQKLEAKLADRDFVHNLYPSVAPGPRATPSRAPANSRPRSSVGPDEEGPACLERA
ncbi:MAG: hypothetical protein ABIR68_01875, partial [Ilumatobacteraceae bacterium]